jgi:hypothetical protein
VYPFLSFRGLVTYDDHLAKFAAECERLSDGRQEQLQEDLPTGYRYQEFTEYVYNRCESKHPLLSVVAETAAWIRTFREDLLRDITSY